MKKIVMLLTLLLCLGCTPEPTIKIDMKFQQGEEIRLVIGGWGQIIEVTPGGKMPYLVRIETDKGPKYFRFREFELKVPQ
jgi:hypothetical protein